MEPWQWAVAVPIALALIGLIARLASRGPDRTEKRLDDHIAEDVKVHERVVKIETEVSTLKEEVRSLREMRHEILENVTKTLASWYTSIIDRFK